MAKTTLSTKRRHNLVSSIFDDCRVVVDDKEMESLLVKLSGSGVWGFSKVPPFSLTTP